MAYQQPSLADEDREDAYASLLQQIPAVLDGETNITARMATISALLAQAFPDRFFWVGFYCVDPEKQEELIVGPYQGTMGCLRIPFGRGVCGSVAASGETMIVRDVHALANHITCDARSQSEIVVPVRDRAGTLIAVLDVDSEQKSAFDQRDQQGLEAIVNAIFTS